MQVYRQRDNAPNKNGPVTAETNLLAITGGRQQKQ